MNTLTEAAEGLEVYGDPLDQYELQVAEAEATLKETIDLGLKYHGQILLDYSKGWNTYFSSLFSQIRILGALKKLGNVEEILQASDERMKELVELGKSDHDKMLDEYEDTLRKLASSFVDEKSD